MSALAPPAGLGQTIVIIRANDWRADTTDSFGQFDFSHVRPGTYEFVARRVGYQATRDSIAVPERGGLSLTVQLAQSVYDGACSGYAGLMVRNPWWKFW